MNYWIPNLTYPKQFYTQKNRLTQKNSTNFETHRDKKYTSFCCCTSIVVSGGRGRAAIVAVVTFSIVLLLRDGNFCLTHGYSAWLGPIKNRAKFGFFLKKKTRIGYESGPSFIKTCPEPGPDPVIYLYPKLLKYPYIYINLKTKKFSSHSLTAAFPSHFTRT